MADTARALRAIFYVRINGLDVSDRINPYLTSIQVQQLGGGTDHASVELADDYGQLAIPPQGASFEVELGWHDEGAGIVFEGTVLDTTSLGGRSGRYLRVEGYGTDFFGKAKQPQEDHVDDGTLGEAAAKFGGAGGLSVAVHSALAGTKRDWWGINRESFLHWGQRMASELGGVFKVQGSHAVLVPQFGSVSVSGLALGGVIAAAGDNLINWSITPSVARPQHTGFVANFFDMLEAKWKQAKSSQISIARGLASAIGVNRFAAADADGAAQSAAGASQNEYGMARYGTVTIIGNPAARPMATCTIKGAREGVDGAYTIWEADHRYSRGEGYTTTLQLMPSGGA